MDMSLTEKLEVTERVDDFARIMFSSEKLRENVIVFKMISSLVRKAGADFEEVNEMRLMDKSTFQLLQNQLVQSLATIATTETLKPELLETYSTGQIAKYFGVSQTTISKWIAQGRFEGVSRDEPGRHVEITSDTYFNYPSKKRVQVRDVVVRYKERERQFENNTESEMDFVIRNIGVYEDKYGSLDVLREKIQSGALKSAEASMDLDVWAYFLQRRDKLIVTIRSY